MRANGDFGAEAKLAAVVEAGRRIDHDCGRIDLLDKRINGSLILTDNHLSMTTVLSNMLDGFIDIRDHVHRHNQGHILGVEIVVAHGDDLWPCQASLCQHRQRLRITAQFDSMRQQRFRNYWNQRGGSCAFNQHHIQRVTHARALYSAVDHDVTHMLQLGTAIYVGVYHADATNNHRHGGVFYTKTMERCSSARNHHIHVGVELQ